MRLERVWGMQAIAVAVAALLWTEQSSNAQLAALCTRREAELAVKRRTSRSSPAEIRCRFPQCQLQRNTTIDILPYEQPGSA